IRKNGLNYDRSPAMIPVTLGIPSRNPMICWTLHGLMTPISKTVEGHGDASLGAVSVIRGSACSFRQRGGAKSIIGEPGVRLPTGGRWPVFLLHAEPHPVRGVGRIAVQAPAGACRRSVEGRQPGACHCTPVAQRRSPDGSNPRTVTNPTRM